MIRKMHKKIISAIVILSLVMTSYTLNIMAEDNAVNEGGRILKKIHVSYMEKEVVYNSTDDKEELAMKNIYLSKIMETNEMYSKYYGGSYIEESKIVVLLTKVDENIISFLTEIIGEDFLYKQCTASLQELTNIHTYILHFCKNYVLGQDDNIDKLILSIAKLEIDVKQNVVCVGMTGYDAEDISLFKKNIVDNEYVRFEYAEHVQHTSTSLRAGRKIYLTLGVPRDPDDYYSMGFRCRRLKSDGSYEYGFVTAAHNNRLAWMVYSELTDDPVGMIYARSFSNYGDTDAAFVCVTGADYVCSDRTAYCGETYSFYPQSASLGDMLYMEGALLGVHMERCSARILCLSPRR